MSESARKIPVLRLVAYVIMIVGILLFVMTPLFIRYLKFDTDLLGIFIVILGLVVLIVSEAVRLIVKKTRKQDIVV